MNTEALRRTAYVMIIIVLSLLLSLLALKYILPALLPFLIGWGIAFALRPLSVYLAHKAHIKLRIVRPVVTVAVCAVGLGLISLGGYRLMREVWQIFTEFGEGEELKAFLSGFVFSGGVLDDVLSNFGTSASEVVFEIISSIISSLAGFATSFVASIPRVALFCVIALISTMYFAVDLEGINSTVMSVFPDKARVAVRKFKNGFLLASVRYLRSYFILFVITFVIMLLGFMLLRVRYFALLALLIATLDLLPIIGVGTFLIPYGIFEIVRGNTYLGVGLFILFAAQTVIRELAEPKILGKSFGVHPLLTLVILYLGYTFFGFFGLLLMPLFTVVVEILFGKKQPANINRSGTC